MQKIIPIYREQSKEFFVDKNLLQPVETFIPTNVPSNPGTDVFTSALAIGKKFDLLAISQTEALYETGLFYVTDSIDPAISLENIYIKFHDSTKQVSDEVVKFYVGNMLFTVFSFTDKNNYNEIRLKFVSSGLVIPFEIATKFNLLTNVVGSFPYSPEPAESLTFMLDFNLVGMVNLQTRACEVYASSICIHMVYLNNIQYTTTNVAEVVGYDLNANRVNFNRKLKEEEKAILIPQFSIASDVFPLDTSNSKGVVDYTASNITISKPLNLGKPLNEVTDIGFLRNQVEYLYQILDDISSTADLAGNDHGVYRNLVERLQKKKNNAIVSDGKNLFIIAG